MWLSIKKYIKSFILKDPASKDIIPRSVTFYGGITPISETRAEDVFIVGFPKSGNTLMQHILAHLYFGFNEQTNRTLINMATSDVYASSHYHRFDAVSFFKSHELPQPSYQRVIYILRDGREALLSYYHMLQNMGKPIDLNALYAGDVKLFGALWHEHIDQWEANPYQADILFVKYEDLLENKIKELERICAFLNIERSTEALEKVADLSSLEHMKFLEKQEDWKAMKSGKFKSGKNFVRKGSKNSYLEEVDPKLIKTFEAMSQATLKKHKYT
ncbi:MAG: hypothetical protein ACJARZ_002924 [Dokdonia sp.]|jgi:hypothetical protein